MQTHQRIINILIAHIYSRETADSISAHAYVGVIYFRAHSRGYQQDRFPVGCWTEGLSSSLAVGHQPRSAPCHLGLSLGQLTARQLDPLGVSGTEGVHRPTFATYSLLGTSH